MTPRRPKEPVAGTPWEGLTPSQRKRMATDRLKELRETPSEARKRATEEAGLLEEIQEAERDQASSDGERSLAAAKQEVAAYALKRMLVKPRFDAALRAMREAVGASTDAEEALRRAQAVLAQAVGAEFQIRFDQESEGISKERAMALKGNLSLEAQGLFRKRWADLLQEAGAGDVFEGIVIGDDPLTNALAEGLNRVMAEKLRGRPVFFSVRGGY
jgi:hypothetical protein